MSFNFYTVPYLEVVLSLFFFFFFLEPGLGLASLSSRHFHAYVCVNLCTHLSPLLTKALKSVIGIHALSSLSPIYRSVGSFLLASVKQGS